MAVRDLASQRLFVTLPLAAEESVACSAEQAHYVRSVLRMPDGASIIVFNGRDGEWRGVLRHDGKRGARVEGLQLERAQESGPDLWYVFAPLKRSRLDYMVQKAVEMGASRLLPVLTQHTVAERVNTERMRANAVEAAEQCGILRVPEIDEPQKLLACLASWPAERTLVFCDEGASHSSPLEALVHVPQGPVGVLIGPEGGFADDERVMIAAKPFVRAISLGPRIMRADTAAVAALALVNAVIGDWR